MAFKMAAKEERFYYIFFSNIKKSAFFMSENCLNAMNVCFLYKICNFEIF